MMVKINPFHMGFNKQHINILGGTETQIEFSKFFHSKKVVLLKSALLGAPGWLTWLSVQPLVSAQVMIS